MRYRNITDEAYRDMQERGRRQRISQNGKGGMKQRVPRSSPYKSKWETAYANKLEGERLAGLVMFWYYEPFSL